MERKKLEFITSKSANNDLRRLVMDVMKSTSPVFLSKTHQGNRVTKPKIIQEYGNTGLTENVPRVSPWSGFLFPRPPPPECVFPPSLFLAPRNHLPFPFSPFLCSCLPPQANHPLLHIPSAAPRAAYSKAIRETAKK